MLDAVQRAGIRARGVRAHDGQDVRAGQDLVDVALHVIGGLSPQQPRVKVRWMTTGARAKAWCLLIYAEASLSLSLSLSLYLSLSKCVG